MTKSTPPDPPPRHRAPEIRPASPAAARSASTTMAPSSRSDRDAAGIERAARQAPHSAAGSMPSVSRRPISRNSSARSSLLRTSSVTTPWPLASTAHQPGLGPLFGGDRVPACRRYRAGHARPDRCRHIPRRASTPDYAGIPRRPARDWRSRRPAAHARAQTSCVTSYSARAVASSGVFSLPAACRPKNGVLLLDGELIERQMLGGFRDRELQFVAPTSAGVWSGRA